MTITPFSHSNQKPWALLISVYITQYIGLAFIFTASVAIFRDMGMALNKIALLNLIALPLLLKILYAPFVDNIRPSLIRKQLQGRYRGWLIIAQFLMMLLLIGISLLDMTDQFGLILVLMLIYALAVSIQDVAIDGLSCKIFAKEERQRANSLQFSGNLLGNIIGGGLVLMAYPWLGWQGAISVLAVLTGLSWLQLLGYVEPQSEYRENDHSNSEHSIWQSLKSLMVDIWQFIKRYKAWFVLLLTYPIGFSAGFALLNPLLVDAGWSLADIGFVTKVFGSLVGVVSALSASLLIDKYGRVNTLLMLTIIQAVALLLILFLSNGYTTKLIVYGVVGAYFIINPALMTTVATLAMDKASTKSAKATFFTLQLGIFSFMGFAYAGIAMALASSFGYSPVIIASVLLTLTIVIFMYSKQSMFAI